MGPYHVEFEAWLIDAVYGFFGFSADGMPFLCRHVLHPCTPDFRDTIIGVVQQRRVRAPFSRPHLACGPPPKTCFGQCSRTGFPASSSRGRAPLPPIFAMCHRGRRQVDRDGALIGISESSNCRKRSRSPFTMSLITSDTAKFGVTATRRVSTSLRCSRGNDLAAVLATSFIIQRAVESGSAKFDVSQDASQSAARSPSLDNISPSK